MKFLDSFIFNPYFELFEHSLFNDFLNNTKPSSFPLYDIWEEKDKAVLEFALAGYSPEQLKVEVVGSTLKISGSGKTSANGNGNRRIARRSFTQTFNAKGFDLENVDVTFINGMLKVELPRVVEEKSAVKEIAIKAPTKQLSPAKESVSVSEENTEETSKAVPA